MAEKKITIIRIRRGRPGVARYCACSDDGTPIRGFDKLSHIRKYWEKEIKWGRVQLVRELDQEPNMEPIKKSIEVIEGLLRAYGRKK